MYNGNDNNNYIIVVLIKLYYYYTIIISVIVLETNGIYNNIISEISRRREPAACAYRSKATNHVLWTYTELRVINSLGFHYVSHCVIIRFTIFKTNEMRSDIIARCQRWASW